jgi:hypothetical protein
MLKRQFYYFEFIIFITMVVLIVLCIKVEPIVRHNIELVDDK